MELARLGVSIDPSATVAGGQRVKQELREIGTTAAQEIPKIDKHAKQAGETIKKTGKDAKAGFGEMAGGVMDALDAVGLLDNGFGMMVRRIDMMVRTGSRLASLWAIMTAAQTANTASAAAGTAAATTNAVAQNTSAVTAARAAVASTSAAAATARQTAANAANTASAATNAAAIRAQTTAIVSMAAAYTRARTLQQSGLTVPPRPQAPRLGTSRAAFQTIDIDAQAIDRASGSLLRLGNAGGAIPPIIGRAGASMGSAGGQAGSLLARIAGLVGGMGPLIAIIGGLIVVVTALVTAFAALSLGISLVRQGMDLAGPVQRTEMSLRTMTGSMRDSISTMEALRKLSRDTGADLGGSMDTVKRFIALGFNPAEAVQLNKSILDVAGSIGMSSEEAKLLGMALAQVQAKGVVSMEELRQQIAEKGVPVIEELQRKTGKFGQEFFKAVEGGQVPAKDLIDLFMNMEGGFARLKGGAENLTKTFPGAVARMKAVWSDLLIDIGKPVNTALVPMINAFSDWLEKLKPLATTIGNSIGNAIKVLHMALTDGSIGTFLSMMLMKAYLMAVSYWIQLKIRMFAGVIQLITTNLTMALTLPIRIFGMLLSTTIKLLAGVLTGNFDEAIQASAKTMGTGFWNVIKWIAGTIYNEFGQALTNVANSFMDAMTDVVNAIGSSINSILDTASSVPGVGKLVTSGRFAKMGYEESHVTFNPAKLPDLNKSVGQMLNLENNPANIAFDNYVKDALAKWDKKYGTSTEDPMKKPPLPIPGGTPGLDSGKGGSGGAEDSIKKADEVRSQLTDLMKEWGNVSKQIDGGLANIANSISQNVTSNVTDLITGAKDLKTAFADMTNSIINDIIKTIVQLTIQLTISKALKASGYENPYLQYAGVAAGAVAHSGGTVGEDLSQIRKFHSGGQTSSNERIVKVERGETILTRRRAGEISEELRARRAPQKQQSGNTATIVNVMDKNEIADVIARNPGAVINAMSSALPAVRRMILSGQRV